MFLGGFGLTGGGGLLTVLRSSYILPTDPLLGLWGTPMFGSSISVHTIMCLYVCMFYALHTLWHSTCCPSVEYF